MGVCCGIPCFLSSSCDFLFDCDPFFLPSPAQRPPHDMPSPANHFFFPHLVPWYMTLLSTMSKKRKSASASASSSSLFTALSKLENDDVHAAKIRRRASTASASRSLAARAQTDVAGELIQCRILLQRAVGEIFEAGNGGSVGEEDNSGKDDDTTAVMKSADRLLIRLLEARSKLANDDDDGDDKINYDHLVGVVKSSESESDSGDNDASPTSLNHILSSEYDGCRSEWKDTFNRRHHDLHAGLTAKAASKFRVIFDQSFWNQVESAVSHERLMQSAESSDPDGKLVTMDGSKAYQYDDSKIYQHMLRDFVALGASAGGRSTSAGLAADAAAERLRRAAQKKKGQSAKDIDRKASKGRKIRFSANPKLENFTFPVSRPVPTMGEDDWFRSLFGGAGIRKTTTKS